MPPESNDSLIDQPTEEDVKPRTDDPPRNAEMWDLEQSLWRAEDSGNEEKIVWSEPFPIEETEFESDPLSSDGGGSEFEREWKKFSLTEPSAGVGEISLLTSDEPHWNKDRTRAEQRHWDAAKLTEKYDAALAASKDRILALNCQLSDLRQTRGSEIEDLRNEVKLAKDEHYTDAVRFREEVRKHHEYSAELVSVLEETLAAWEKEKVEHEEKLQRVKREKDAQIERWKSEADVLKRLWKMAQSKNSQGAVKTGKLPWVVKSTSEKSGTEHKELTESPVNIRWGMQSAQW